LIADGADFLHWQRQLGSAAAAKGSNALPEPSAGALALVASLFGAITRPRCSGHRSR
jgi:hypothetical protein